MTITTGPPRTPPRPEAPPAPVRALGYEPPVHGENKR